jgi:hypothetical protein
MKTDEIKLTAEEESSFFIFRYAMMTLLQDTGMSLLLPVVKKTLPNGHKVESVNILLSYKRPQIYKKGKGAKYYIKIEAKVNRKNECIEFCLLNQKDALFILKFQQSAYGMKRIQEAHNVIKLFKDGSRSALLNGREADEKFISLLDEYEKTRSEIAVCVKEKKYYEAAELYKDELFKKSEIIKHVEATSTPGNELSDPGVLLEFLEEYPRLKTIQFNH